MGGGELAVFAALVLWALLNVGGVFEHRRWALPSELMRLPVTAGLLATRLAESSWRGLALWGLVLVVMGLALCLLWHRGEFEGARSNKVEKSLVLGDNKV